MAGGPGPYGPGAHAASFPRDSPRSGDGVSPRDRIPPRRDGRRGRTVPDSEPRLTGGGGPADLRLFRPDDRRTPRIRPGRISGSAPSGHGGAGSAPHRSRRAVRSEGERVPVFDPCDLGSDGSPRNRVPGWRANRIEARCLVSTVTESGVRDVRRYRGTVATVPGWFALREVCGYASRVRSTSRPSEVGYSSTRNAGR